MHFERKMIVGFGLASVTLLTLAFLSFQNSRESSKTNQLVTHTNEVLFNIERTIVATLDVVVGQRGFELTGDRSFLEPYTSGREAIQQHLRILRELTRDNPIQQRNIDTLSVLIDRRIRFSKDRIAVVLHELDAGQRSLKNKVAWNDEQLMASRKQGKATMDAVRRMIKKMQDEEYRLLSIRIKANDKQLREFDSTLVGLLIVTFVTLAVVMILLRSSFGALKQSESQTKSARILLQSSIESQNELIILAVDKNYHYLFFNEMHRRTMNGLYGSKIEVGANILDCILTDQDRLKSKFDFDRALRGEGYTTIEEYGGSEKYTYETHYSPIFNDEGEIIGSTAIAADITERRKAEEQLKKVTEDLATANNELEAFSYSISHDLRAPLRSIHGYSRILSEDYGDKLDGEGKKVLDIVMANALKMGYLIDDLLNFSRISRKGLTKTILEMDGLAHEIVAEQLNGRVPVVNVAIHPLKKAVGDPGLIRQVWTNLISNAIKYSGKKECPQIEIGSHNDRGHVVYFIRDNGVGFEMKYAHKLFGVFQRLHKSEDFEGTGVGLAIVHRIISRHGGKVWAESTPDAGSTFLFSLPAS